METMKFAITESGEVYGWMVHTRMTLGHISCLVHEQTPLGRGIRAWWQARLTSDEPNENYIARGGEEKPLFVQASVPVTALVVGSEPDREFAESALAAD